MKSKTKKWSKLTAKQLAAATAVFDDPTYNPPARKPSPRDLAQLRRVQAKAKLQRIPIALEQRLIVQADSYAARRGMSFSDVVADALTQLIAKKSA